MEFCCFVIRLYRFTHLHIKIMKDKKAALAAGLIEPTEKVCVKCHNAESPNYKKFDFAEFSKKIAHPRPKTDAKPESETKPAEAK